MAQAAAAARRRPVLALQLVVAAFVLLRLYMHLSADPFGDEAYYWLWGQKPGLSYFDHPPLHAWLLRLAALLFGWHEFTIRILTWFTLAGTLWLFWRWSARLAPGDPRAGFWRMAAVYLASPLFFGFTLVSYNDHLLVFLCLAAAHAFLTFCERFEAGAPRQTRWLYAGAILLGLAVLTKYNGVFLGLGFALFILVRRQLRPLLRNPHLYLAALLAIAMQAPVIWWNLAEGFASFDFHFTERWGERVGRPPDPMAPVMFVLASILFLSPFLVWPLLRVVRDRPAPGFARDARDLALCVLAVSTLVLGAVAIFRGAFFYWNIVAFIALMPLLAQQIGWRVQLWMHLGFGFAAAVLIVVNFAVMPLGVLAGGREGGSAVNYGWSEVAERVAAAAEAAPGAFVAATRYSTAAQLGFQLRRTDVVAISVDHDQFDHWMDPGAYLGLSAIILADDNDTAAGMDYLRERFTTLTLLEEIPIERFGTLLHGFRIYRGDGYLPPD